MSLSYCKAGKSKSDFHRKSYLLFPAFFFLFFPFFLIGQGSDTLQLIESHYKKGVDLFMEGSYGLAIPLWKKELELKRVFYGEHHLEFGRTNYNLGSAYKNLKIYDQAKKYFENSLSNRLPHFDLEDEKLTSNIINTYKYLGEALMELGDYDQALLLYDAALAKIEENHPAYPGILKYKAQSLEEKKGEYIQKAIELYQESAEIFRKNGRSYEYGKTLCDLGTAYDNNLDSKAAIKNYEQSFSILKSINDYDATYENIIWVASNLGVAYAEIGDYDNAEKTLEEALGIAKDIYGELPIVPDYAAPYSNLGFNYLSKKNYEKALEYYDLSLENIIVGFSGIKNNLSAVEVGGLDFIAPKPDAIDVFSFRAKCLALLGESEEALENYDFIDRIVRELRSEINTESSNLIWVEETRGIFTEAMLLAQEIGESEKAFLFAEKSKAVLLYENLLKEKQNREMNLPDSVQLHLNGLKKELSNFQEELVYAILEEKEKEAAEFRDAIFLKTKELEKYENAINAESGNVKKINLNTENISIDEIKKYSRKENATFLAFHSHEEKLIAFKIKNDDLKVHVYEPNSERKKNITEWVGLISSPLNNNQKNKRAIELGFAVYEDLMMSMQFEEDEKIIIIHDGILQFVPFEALLTEKGNGESFLLKKYRVSYAYSAAVQLQLSSGSGEGLRGNSIVVAPREFKKLPALTSDEPDIVKKILGADLLEKEKATTTGFLENIFSYDLIHLSTHASSGDNDIPQPWIAFRDRKLLLSELYNLNLNTKLMTMSACETAKGEMVEGEGVLSLARGISYVGVPQVITSLWSVNEESTTRIMEAFYRNLKKGTKPSESLRQAKLEYLSQAELSKASPYYWAAFTAIGHDAYQEEGAGGLWLWVFGGGFVLVMLLVYFFRRQK